ncbi:glutamate 5-kinase [Acetobacter fabarum]|jgi:glutamate 5-kinase|uniref:Glutamate 5-kinase n=1 Tax=Acetobacter fabarum TaxID=483199 RepID=A0A269Y2M7_9PROT|nr:MULTISPECIES: glutamate 5-kinase [Acetobacter]MDN6713287.1 glutamate 5-kinase [Acetobacter sp.]MCI1243164.1 glutamate 5-kinase [Acetobacter fabarum]MCI1908961.1 glutamate 5-kinase [Acetobacter fabarum]MCI1927805.1 glutamate 5-kinase [Acetobacter fabarum]MCI1947822.1 glutamate 5-kinase [Acetobacter fabarum]
MTTDSPRPSLLHAKRLVIKIGSALVVDPQKAAPRQEWLASVAADIAVLRKQGVAVSVVSSGAIALARHTLGLAGGPLRLAEKQAAAAVGQISLAQAWSNALSAHGLTAAQLLLTPEDTEDRKRYLNARATLNTLLELGCVPVINENDTIATAEIRFGDNDRLAARVAQMTDADQLVLLSDIDGLYTADPRTNPNAQHLPVIEALTPEIEAMGGEPPPGYSSGGMRTKLLAANIATRSGCAMAIAIGKTMHPLQALMDGARCSWFLPQSNGHTGRKQWIAGSLNPTGEIKVDAGAAEALRKGGSLLPAGVLHVQGNFTQGDLVEVVDASGRILAHGLAAYDADDARRIAGHHSSETASILGWQGRDEIIHRDDLVMV